MPLADGRVITADSSDIRDKILDPDRDRIAGYKQVMPVFKGLIPEDDLLRLIAYVKSLRQDAGGAAAGQTNGSMTP